jgi:hypothetical protein
MKSPEWAIVSPLIVHPTIDLIQYVMRAGIAEADLILSPPDKSFPSSSTLFRIDATTTNLITLESSADLYAWKKLIGTIYMRELFAREQSK